MEFITLTQSLGFKTPYYGTNHLLAGKTYYTFSHFAKQLTARGVGRIVDGTTFDVTHLTPDNLTTAGTFKNTLLYFSGGLGDAVSLSLVLPKIENAYGINFDICCDVMKWDSIFKPMGMRGKHTPYPPDVETLSRYDAVLTDVTDFYDKRKGLTISPIDHLCQGFKLDSDLPEPEFEIKEKTQEKMALPPSESLRVGMNFDSNGAVKSYPEALQIALVEAIQTLGCDVHILGSKKYQNGMVDKAEVYDFRGKTTIAELAALLFQMDFFVGVDSFIVHLANVLKVSSLVLLSTTVDSYFTGYRHIDTLSSNRDCAPCFAVFNDCPKGNPECLAFFHPNIAPAAIAARAAQGLSKSPAGKASSIEQALSLRMPTNEFVPPRRD